MKKMEKTLLETIGAENDVPGYISSDLKNLSDVLEKASAPEDIDMDVVGKMRVRVKDAMGLDVARMFDVYIKELMK